MSDLRQAKLLWLFERRRYFHLHEPSRSQIRVLPRTFFATREENSKSLAFDVHSVPVQAA